MGIREMRVGDGGGVIGRIYWMVRTGRLDRDRESGWGVGS